MRAILVAFLLACFTAVAAEPAAGTPEAPAAPLVVRIQFQGYVDQDSVTETLKALEDAQKAGAVAIVMEWNTGGGSVGAGFRLAKAIEESPVPITCVVDGEADSMGFYLLQSCPVRLMTKRSVLMVHEPLVGGGDTMTTLDLENRLLSLRTLSNAMMEHQAARLKISVKELRARTVNGRQWWMNWAEAMKISAVDGIVQSGAAVADAMRAGKPAPVL